MLKKIIAVEGLFPGQRTDGLTVTAVASFVLNGRDVHADSFLSPQKPPVVPNPSPTIRRKRSAEIDDSAVSQALKHPGCSGSSLQKEVYPDGVHLITKTTTSQSEFEIYKKIYKATLAASPENPSLSRPFVAVPIDEPTRSEICLPKFPKLLSDIDFSEIPSQFKLSVWVTLMHQIIEGTAYLHNTIGVIHRDLKPDNIGIDHAAGVVRIFDFDCSEKLGTQVSPKGAEYYKPPALQTCPSYVCSAYEDIFAIATMMKDIAIQMGIGRSVGVSEILARMFNSKELSILDVKHFLNNKFELASLAGSAGKFWATQKLSQSEKADAVRQQQKKILSFKETGDYPNSTEAIAAALGVTIATPWCLSGGVGGANGTFQNQVFSDGRKGKFF